MDIGMAAFAFRGSYLEISIHEFGFEVRWLVAINASHRAVCSDEWERGLGMIKAREFVPGSRGMTGFATWQRSIRSHLPHAVAELTFVRIGVTGNTGPVFKMVERSVLCLRR